MVAQLAKLHGRVQHINHAIMLQVTTWHKNPEEVFQASLTVVQRIWYARRLSGTLTYGMFVHPQVWLPRNQIDHLFHQQPVNLLQSVSLPPFHLHQQKSVVRVGSNARTVSWQEVEEPKLASRHVEGSRMPCAVREFQMMGVL